MGDDLEDDYVQGGDEYLSEGEDDLSFSHAAHGDADVEGEGIVPDAEGGSPAPVAGGKRKAGEEDVASDSDSDGEAKPTGAGRELTEAERKKEKKRRNKEKLKEKKKQRLTSSALSASGTGGASTSTAAVLTSLRTSQRKALSKLSDLEWEDRSLPDSAVFDTPPAATGSSDLLVSLIRSLSRPLPESAPTENGAPHVLILAASGQRCADLVRELRPLLGPLEKPAAEDKVGASGKQGEKKGGKPAKKAKVEAPLKPKNGEVAKLFAKHFKLSEHITYLQATPLSMAVGTPHRVAELLSAGALKVPPYILFDYTFRDAKQRGLFDNAECCDSIWSSIVAPAQPAVWEGLTKAADDGSSVRLGVF